MERSVVNLIAVLLISVLTALQPAVVVAGAALGDTRARRTGILRAAAIAVGGGILLFGLALLAVRLRMVSTAVSLVLLAVGLVLAMVTVLLLLVRRGAVTGRGLGTLAAVLVGAGHVLDGGPALFGISSSVVHVLLGVVVGAVVLLAVAVGLSVAARRWPPVDLAVLVATLAATLTGLVQVVVSLLHDLLGLWAVQLPSAVTLGATLLAGLVALLVGVAVRWRPAQP